MTWFEAFGLFWCLCLVALGLMYRAGWFSETDEYAGPSQAAPGPHPYEANICAQGRPDQSVQFRLPASPPARSAGADPSRTLSVPNRGDSGHSDPTDALFDPKAIARTRGIVWPETTAPFWVPDSLESKAIH